MIENKVETDQSLVDATYCYVSPKGCWKDGFDYKTETFESFAGKRKLGKKLLQSVWLTSSEKANVTRKMNYNIK